ncbi:hypothetical protein [Saccharothrix lopnurensis]|uniref:Uncharacterized protein n=1 Tax=Saccharothrix lopnurensis TaxID=1670621 RepID=A0ABW1P049_9PSEU
MTKPEKKERGAVPVGRRAKRAVVPAALVLVFMTAVAAPACATTALEKSTSAPATVSQPGPSSLSMLWG